MIEYLQLIAWAILYIAFGVMIGWSIGYRNGHKDGYGRGKAVGRHASVNMTNEVRRWVASDTRTGSVE
jgi:hypothetical protein